jgi:TonB-linked SusC/RagA family outer membrane protein
MKKVRLLILMLTLLLSATVYAQKETFSGVVLDDLGEPVIGASVVQKGVASNGAITDYDGRFRISVEPGATLVVSYVGFVSQEIKAAPNMRVVLVEDSKLLNDVVVIGYGVQKKSVVTASIAKVSADDLEGTAPVRMDNALKGLAAGVNVTSSSGQPGAAARIRVRGIGTINNSNPLYIVDGMPIEGGLDYINPSDIESIEVLKDAASGAIYGARAANGVILVTTKKGKIGKVSVNYNFSQGWQSAWRHRDVLNATEYAIMRNEALVNAGQTPIYADPYQYGEGTDWQDVLFNDNAPVQNHELTVSGANEKLNYFLSAGYYTQEGIVGGNFDRSNYTRMTLRGNFNLNIFDESKNRNWLNKLDVDVNLSYARVKSTGIGVNDQYGGLVTTAVALSPILKPYLETAEEQKAQDEYYSKMYPGVYAPMFYNGKQLALPGVDYNEFGNPIAELLAPALPGWSHKFVSNFAATLQLWDGLKFRTSYSADLSFWGSNWYSKIAYYKPTNIVKRSSAGSEASRGLVWQIENVLMYDKTFGAHTINVVLGQSAFENSGFNVGASRYIINDYSKPWVNASLGLAADGDRDGWAGPSTKHTMSSLFGRLSYNYDERYMVQATIRRDGSSRFGTNNKYGVFPSVSLGWNVMNESFLKQTSEWLNNLKVRFSWGKNGNDNIGDFRYTVLTQGGNNYGFGRGGAEQEIVSTKAAGLGNPDIKWEESEQLDFGVDFGFLNNQVTFSVDWFKKKTNGMLMTMAIPSYVGESKPIGNVGDMENSGLEFEAAYKFNISDAKFQIKGNASYLKNKLIKLGNDTGTATYDWVQGGVGNISRAENGQPWPFFWGYKTDGIFQNYNEVNSYTNADGGLIQPNARPGYVRYVDVNGDGKISDDDKTNIGNGTPDWTFGLTLNAAWKGFDFMMFWQGTAGNEVFDATRRVDIASSNLASWYFGRWTGDGTSNKYPIWVNNDTENWKSSDLYVHDGSYFRLKNIELGYTIPQTLTKKIFISRLRLYVAAENLLTFTKYWGFDPEISSGGTSLGIDYGVYPQPRTYRVGVNVSF